MGRTEITTDARHRYWLSALHGVLGLPLTLVSLFATGQPSIALAKTTDGAMIGVVKVDRSACKDACPSDETWRVELIVTHAIVAVSAAICLQAALVSNEECARSVAVRTAHALSLLAASALAISVLVFVNSQGVKAQWGCIFAELAATAELIACALVIKISIDARNRPLEKPEMPVDEEAAARTAWEISLFGTVLSVDVPQKRVSVLRRSMQPIRPPSTQPTRPPSVLQPARPRTMAAASATEPPISLKQVPVSQPQQNEAPRVQSVPVRISTVQPSTSVRGSTAQHGHRRQFSDDSTTPSSKTARRQLTLPPYSIIEEHPPVQLARTTQTIRRATAPVPAHSPPRYTPQTDAQRFAAEHKSASAATAERQSRSGRRETNKPVRSSAAPQSASAADVDRPAPPPKRSGSTSTRTIANVAALLEAYGGLDADDEAGKARETLCDAAGSTL